MSKWRFAVEFYEFACESKEMMLTMDVKQMELRLANDAKITQSMPNRPQVYTYKAHQTNDEIN